MPLSDQELEHVADRIVERLRGGNGGDDEKITLAIINQKLEHICPIVEGNHRALLSLKAKELPKRVNEAEDKLVGMQVEIAVQAAKWSVVTAIFTSVMVLLIESVIRNL